MDSRYNYQTELENMISQIRPLDEKAQALAFERQQTLVKPPGSLGRLEDISVQLAGITGRTVSVIEHPAVAVFSADNGVVEEGIASAPQSVTLSQTINFTKKITGVGALAKTFGIELLVIDMGIASLVPADISSDSTGQLFEGKILDRKIAFGTGNIRKGPAMTRDQAFRAILTGIEVVRSAAANGYDAIGIGEMGIGNTTTGTAVACAILGLDPDEVTGRGGGLTDEGLRIKKAVIHDALVRASAYIEHPCAEQADSGKRRALDILAQLGGFDIAAMTGAYIGCALCRVPAVIDGYISACAALAARELCPLTRNFMIPSHSSAEPGYTSIIDALSLRPMLDLDMRLGEGSGCILAFQILKGACGAMEHMATFEEASINDDYLEEIRAM